MAEMTEPIHLVAWQFPVNNFIPSVGLAVSAHFFDVKDQGYRIHCVEWRSRQSRSGGQWNKTPEPLTSHVLTRDESVYVRAYGCMCVCHCRVQLRSFIVYGRVHFYIASKTLPSALHYI